ncbi:MAG TPA: hypothetical protein VH120_18390 [Gemmataceae bacterium]|nr:hypothetical protein [Gemmataceae bacterium]
MNVPNARLRVEQLGTHILPSANAVIGARTTTADPLAHAANPVVLPSAAPTGRGWSGTAVRAPLSRPGSPTGFSWHQCRTAGSPNHPR